MTQQKYYASVDVLTISWLSHDLYHDKENFDLEQELTAFREFCNDQLGFRVHRIHIPSESKNLSEETLRQELQKFYDTLPKISPSTGFPKALVIILYGGHGLAGPWPEDNIPPSGYQLHLEAIRSTPPLYPGQPHTANWENYLSFQRLFWADRRYPTTLIDWSYVQAQLVIPERYDHLVIYDCCQAASIVARRPPKDLPKMKLQRASLHSFLATRPVINAESGPYSFTKMIQRTFQILSSKTGGSFTIQEVWKELRNTEGFQNMLGYLRNPKKETRDVFISPIAGPSSEEPLNIPILDDFVDEDSTPVSTWRLPFYSTEPNGMQSNRGGIRIQTKQA